MPKTHLNRALLWSLFAVSLIHAVVLFTPLFKIQNESAQTPITQSIRMVLQKSQTAIETPERLETSEQVITPITSAESTAKPLAQQTVAVPQTKENKPPVLEDIPVPVHSAPSINRIGTHDLARIRANLYSPGEPGKTKIIPNYFQTKSRSHQTAFHFRERVSLEGVLNPVPDQLPFANGPQYALDFYDPGAMGDVQRWFDSVTIEKEWITKYGTKVKCAWILIIAACGWD